MTMKPRTTIVEQMAWKCAKEIWPIGGPSNQEMIVNGYLAGFKAAREMAVGLRNGEETVTVSDNTVREKGEEKCIIEMEEKRRMATRL